MKKITFLAALFAGFAMNAQTTIFEDDFEAYENFIIADVGDWTLIDVDQLGTWGFNGHTWPDKHTPKSFMVFNATATAPPLNPTDNSNFLAHSGNKAMTSFASMVDGTTNANNDWMISPKITLGAQGNQLSFMAKAAHANYTNELFNVLISTVDTDPNNFTEIASNLTPQAIEWGEFTFDLDAYAGQDVYIAINHVASDQFGFQIDDFIVTSGVLSIDDMIFDGFTFSVANNQLNLSAKNSMDSVALYNMIGQQVASQKLNNTKESVNISELQSGIYIAVISIDGARKTFKFVKN